MSEHRIKSRPRLPKTPPPPYKVKPMLEMDDKFVLWSPPSKYDTSRLAQWTRIVYQKLDDDTLRPLSMEHFTDVRWSDAAKLRRAMAEDTSAEDAASFLANIWTELALDNENVRGMKAIAKALVVLGHKNTVGEEAMRNE